jgi:hypothetical protein
MTKKNEDIYNYSAEIIKLYKTDKNSLHNIAKIYDVSRCTIWRLLKNKGIESNFIRNRITLCIDCKVNKIDYRHKRCRDCYWKYTRMNHPLSGRKRPEHSKKMIGNNNPMFGSIRSKKWKDEHSKRMLGDKNPTWKGGVSKLPYAFSFDKKLKNKIKKRDNYTCQNCFKIEDLTIHHIDYDKMNSSEYNLITLCQSCNSKANFGRKLKQEMYENKIGKIYGNNKT